MQTEQNKDETLWRIAQKRASFKRSFAAYFFVNAFLVAIWFFTGGIHSYFWPVWPMLGWGLGIAFQYSDAYNTGSKLFSAEQEYEKLKNQNR